ncbi:hypothetical protein K6X14_02715 [Xanthomonas euvesicatoria pv. allii]|nr:hypothetical protein [Xanthomonas euvesicatoria]MCP3042061.1 hypothetical protein [Xanthomonas euvesicatoria pv. allii]
MAIWNIHPNSGLGPLKFGMTQAHVAKFETVMGLAKEIIEESLPDGSLAVNQFHHCDAPLCSFQWGRLSHLDWVVRHHRRQVPGHIAIQRRSQTRIFDTSTGTRCRLWALQQRRPSVAGVGIGRFRDRIRPERQTTGVRQHDNGIYLATTGALSTRPGTFQQRGSDRNFQPGSVRPRQAIRLDGSNCILIGALTLIPSMTLIAMRQA